jgi:hypothetical protein
MPTGLVVVIALATLATTYFSCMRPMADRPGHAERGGPPQDGDLDRQVAALQEEVRMLRARDSLDRERATDA